MKNKDDKAGLLLNRLNDLLKRQDDFSREISNLKVEIEQLRSAPEVQAETKESELPKEIREEKQQPPKATSPAVKEGKPEPRALTSVQTAPAKKAKVKINLEKFIGENLINKIGIAITVIGVSIGAKYSIEHDLISPLTRIILGYLAGIILLVVGMRLKRKYVNFSAVLISGAMAIFYFITYAAYSFYNLIPQTLTFWLMVVFTAFTVLSAIKYNKQVIAHIGLIGAYAVPYLLSDEAGNIAVLLFYTSIINIGILIIAFQRYWKALYFSSFTLSWLIYLSWFIFDYQTSEHFVLAFSFLPIFFLIFYATFISYKLLHEEKFNKLDVVYILANAFIFFGVGYSILDDHEKGTHLLGLFTLCNGILHFIVSVIVYRQKLADRNLFYLVSGLVLVFLTISIPVQLDGNWVTLLWAGEAALLFWIGRTNSVKYYEKLSYILMLLAFFSLFQDWKLNYGTYHLSNPESYITPVFNINLLSSILFVLAFAFIYWLYHHKKYPGAFESKSEISKLLSLAIPSILIFSLFYAFYIEIENYWNQLFTDSVLTITSDGEGEARSIHNYDLNRFKSVWLLNYTLVFLSILSFINIKKIRNKQLGIINFALNIIVLVAFLSAGLYELSELRESYLEKTMAQYYEAGSFHINFRYVSFSFVALNLSMCYLYSKQEFLKSDLQMIFDLLLHTSVLWILSSELLSWMDIGDYTGSYKLGLSILFGTYALFLIILGIWKHLRYLRISAIALFGATLIKLFFYDIAHLDTIAKTILFVSLGVLLLIISFLYNKYKHFIFSDHED